MPGKKSLSFKFLDAYRATFRAPAAVVKAMLGKKGDARRYMDGNGNAYTSNGCAVISRGAGWHTLVPFGADAARTLADLEQAETLINDPEVK